MPVSSAAMCSNFRRLSEAHGRLADNVQTLIDRLYDDLMDLIGEPYRSRFRTKWEAANTIDKKIDAVERAIRNILDNFDRIVRQYDQAVAAGAPVVFWPRDALAKLRELKELLRALKALRELQRVFASIADYWCG